MAGEQKPQGHIPSSESITQRLYGQFCGVLDKIPTRNTPLVDASGPHGAVIDQAVSSIDEDKALADLRMSLDGSHLTFPGKAFVVNTVKTAFLTGYEYPTDSDPTYGGIMSPHNVIADQLFNLGDYSPLSFFNADFADEAEVALYNNTVPVVLGSEQTGQAEVAASSYDTAEARHTHPQQALAALARERSEIAAVWGEAIMTVHHAIPTQYGLRLIRHPQ